MKFYLSVVKYIVLVFENFKYCMYFVCQKVLDILYILSIFVIFPNLIYFRNIVLIFFFDANPIHVSVDEQYNVRVYIINKLLIVPRGAINVRQTRLYSLVQISHSADPVQLQHRFSGQIRWTPSRLVCVSFEFVREISV